MELEKERGKRLVYFSVDTETSGNNPLDYSLLSVGACLVVNPGKVFYGELKPREGTTFEPQAMSVNGLSWDCLQVTGLSPRAAMEAWCDWVDQCAPPERCKPVFVGFNATFDWMFTHTYFMHYVKRDPFGISGMDLKAFAAGLHREGWDKTYKKDLRKRYPAPEGVRHTHNALDDAIEQADLMRQLLTAHGMLFEVV